MEAGKEEVKAKCESLKERSVTISPSSQRTRFFLHYCPSSSNLTFIIAHPRASPAPATAKQFGRLSVYHTSAVGQHLRFEQSPAWFCISYRTSGTQISFMYPNRREGEIIGIYPLHFVCLEWGTVPTK